MKRLAEKMTAEQLNSEGCLQLVCTFLAEAREEYRWVRRGLHCTPDDKELLRHYKLMRAFFTSEYFHNITGGMVDGQAVLDSLDKEVI